MMFEIEKGIPVPATLPRSKYPFGQMEVGDSFACSASQNARVRVAAHKYGKDHGLVFTARKIGDDSYRVWRIK